MTRKKLPADKYFKKRRNIRLWHRLLLAAGCVVVFVTTYMLILPAITAEVGSITLFDESVSSGGAVTPEEDDSFIISGETTEETTEETIYDETGETAEETSDCALEDETENSPSGGGPGSKGSEAETEETSETEGETDSEEETSEKTSEEKTSEEETSEKTSEEPAEDASEGGAGGGNLTSTVVLEDGTVLTLTAEEQKALELGEIVLSEILLTTVGESNSSSSVSFSGTGSGGTYVCEYDPDTETFTLSLKASLTISLDEIKKNTYVDSDWNNTIGNSSYSLNNYAYYYTFDLPGDIALTNSAVYDSSGNYNVYLGEDGEDYVFFYVPQTDGEGNTYYKVVIAYTSDYISNQSGTTLTGTMNISAYVESSAYDSATHSIVISGNSFTEDIEITSENITWGESETLYSDLSVFKTASYNSSGNTITYTVRVFTQKGTGGEVTITDVITDTDSLGLSSDGLLSVTYSTGEVKANLDYGLNVSGETSLTDMGDIPSQSEASGGSAYYYYDSGGNLIIVLPELSGAAEYDDGYWVGYNEYLITYTYSVDPDSDKEYSVGNTAAASSHDSSADADLTDTASAKVTISSVDKIDKTGSVSGTTITWTITAGAAGEDISGYVLTDSMFSQTTDVTITDSSGNAVDGSCYTITYIKDTNGEITGIESITFNSGSLYKITYTTEVPSSWSSATYTNEVSFTSGDGGSVYSDSASVSAKGTSGSSFSKSYLGKTLNDDGTYNLQWKITYTVPESGIPSGTVFYDNISGDGQYITYNQAWDIIYAIQAAFGANNVGDFYFANAGGNRWYTSDNVWVYYSNIATDGKYYMFKFTVLNDIVYSEDGSASQSGNSVSYAGNTTAITYYTTADVSGVTNTQTYYNTTYIDSNTYSEASTTYEKGVVKYGVNSYGYNQTGSFTLSTTTEDNTVEWVVLLRLDDSGKTYTLTDTLPSGADLTAVKVCYYDTSNIDNYTALSAGETTSYQGMGLSYTTAEDNGQTVVTVTVDDTAGTRSADNLYIRLTCSVSVDTTAEKNSSGSIVETYSNSVSVTTDGGTSYGESEQTTYVSYSETDTGTKDEDTSKSHQFDQNNNTINYTVDINKNAVTYTTGYPEKDSNGNYTGDEYPDLTITDTLTYSTYPSYGTARSVGLSSVKLYYAKTNDDGSIAYDNDGNLQAGDAVSTSDYSWSYKTSENFWNGVDGTITNTITLTVPNGVALVLKYSYVVSIESTIDASSTNYEANASNSAVLSAEGNVISTVTDYTTSSEKYEENEQSLKLNGSHSYTIYKVDEDNFSLALSGAEFDLYVYDADSGKFVNIGTWETNSSGQITVSAQKDGNETSGYTYTVTLSDNSTYVIPGDTICYFVESAASSSDYTLDTTRYYFYYGSTYITTASSCTGYNEACTAEGGTISADNLITAHTQYITNSHSADYYSDKTSLSVKKTWVDSEGTEYEKTDGSISFILYRIFTYASTGAPGLAPGQTSGQQESTGSGSSSTSANKISVSYGYGWNTWSITDNTSLGTETITVDDNANATVNITFTENTGWLHLYCDTEVYDLDSNSLIDTISAGSGSWNTSGNVSVCSYTFSPGGSDRNLYFLIKNSTAITSEQCILSLSSDYEVTDTSSGSAGETETEVEVEDETETETETAAGDQYIHIFNDDFSSDDFESDNTWKGTWSIQPDTYIASDGTKSTDTFFKISGDLSWDPGDESLHGTLLYDVDGDGTVDASTEKLQGCLKIESKTSITFTPTNDGNLLLAFNAAGGVNNENEATVVNGVNINGTYYPASSNLVKAGLTGGTEYTITRENTCYLFYMSFTEGDISSSASSEYLHSFNNGNNSEFYTISGSLGTSSSSYGVVTYNGEEISQFLKMNSKASIVFDTTNEEDVEDGTLYIVLTDAKKNNRTVGVTLDGTTKEATASGEYDSLGNEVYIVTTRVSKGKHTITRINSTEYQIYYIGFVPDDYANAEVIDYTPYSQYAEKLGTFDLNYSNAWSWSSVTYAFNYVSDGTDGYEEGEIVGYYSYYVVEVDEDGSFITQYKNVTTDGEIGISAGTMGIINQINDSSSAATHISVSKSWLSSDGQTLADSDTNVLSSIEVGLYAKVHVYDQYADSYTAGTSYSWDTSGYGSSSNLTGETDEIFTISGPVQNSGSNVGMITYDGTSYTYYLKFDGTAEIIVDSPAKKGIISLLTVNRGNSLAKNIGFDLTSPSGTLYRFYYSNTEDKLVWLSTDTLEGSAVEYNTADNPTVVTGATATGTTGNEANGVIEFTLMTDEAGKWTIKKCGDSTYGAQAYLLSVGFAYQFQYLTDDSGILVGTYTIDGTNDSWEKTISSLPLYIYDDDGETPIGYYSYYIEEISPDSGYETTMTYTMELSDIVTGFELETDSGSGEPTGKMIIYFYDKSTGSTTSSTASYISYTEGDITQSDGSTTTGITSVTIDAGSYSSYMAITKGSVAVVNKVKEEDIVLPESGGDGGLKYILAGTLTSLAAILLLYKRRKSLSAGP